MTQDKPKIVALVPMRHHSERVPQKNYRQMVDRPLYAHILETLLACPAVDAIVVDTDSSVIAGGIVERFAKVHIIDRPEELQGDTVPMNDILRHDVLQIDADYYLQTHSTNPLLRSTTISQAIETFLAQYPAHDSLFSVTPRQIRFWDGETKPINHDPAVLIRTQDLAPIYEENSCIYIFERSTFLARGNRLGQRPLMFEIGAEEAWDIDEVLDFHIVEYLLRLRTDAE
jgi:CMP-N-acetylneuraminic acid synthetase